MSYIHVYIYMKVNSCYIVKKHITAQTQIKILKSVHMEKMFYYMEITEKIWENIQNFILI